MNNQKSLIKQISSFVGLMFLLVCFLPVWGQENCDLRNNSKTGELEIYIDVILETKMLLIDSTEMVWKTEEKKLTKWCNVDSLCKIHKGTFKYEWGIINLQHIVNMRKYFELFMTEYQNKNGKGKKSN